MSLHSALRHLFRTRKITYGKYVHFRSLQSEVSQNKCIFDLCRCGKSREDTRHTLDKTKGVNRLRSAGSDNLKKRSLYTTQTKLDNKKSPDKMTEEISRKIETTDVDVPIIVKLLRQKMEEEKNNEQDGIKLKQTLSIETLQKTLEDIRWDMDASLRRSNVEELAQDSEPEDSYIRLEGATSDMNIRPIEDIFVDDDVHIHRRNTSKTPKQKIKGTPDPSIPKSDVPCSGCGSVLHCQDPIIPGYMPSEKLKCLTKEQMRTSMCQRCFLIQMYNMYLKVSVPSDSYPKILKEIRNTRALVMVVVDLFDMKNSVYSGLLEHIGTHRPLFVVGNKVDLIPEDSPGFLDHTKKALIEVCELAGLNPTGRNIQHVCLVSAKTGFGIEELVSKLMVLWKLQGHVYVVGSTNAGKSTLFNALLMSDYCKSIARGFINRATVSLWPGTTLSLLKFPIISPAPWRLALRAQRLRKDQEKFDDEETLRRSRLLEYKSYKATVLTGHVGLTDFCSAKEEAVSEEMSGGQDLVSFKQDKLGRTLELSGHQQLGQDLKDHEYKPEKYKMYWCNDTPGVVNPDQIINLLEPEELAAMLPRAYVVPQCVIIKPGQVLFVSGLGRIDYIEGKRSVYLTVHAAYTVPLHVKDAGEADEFYQQAVGKADLGVPLGNEERLLKIPSLIGKEFFITSIEKQTAAADIQLSSIGWVSVATDDRQEVRLRAYTPGGRGLYLRVPALLPNYTKFKGKRKGKTPFYRQPKPRE